MAIAKQCYIRDVPKKHQTLLKKAGAKFSLNTSPSILLKVLEEFFVRERTIEEQAREISTLKRELSSAREELTNFKIEVGTIFQIENELKNKKDQIANTL